MAIWSWPTRNNEDDPWLYDDSSDDSNLSHYSIPSSNDESISDNSISSDSISVYIIDDDSLTDDDDSTSVDSLDLDLE